MDGIPTAAVVGSATDGKKSEPVITTQPHGHYQGTTAISATGYRTEVDKSTANEEKEWSPFMSAAISSALAGITQKHGGPFGACIVKNGVMIAVSHNMVLKNCDPTCHAEMNCIRAACKALGTHDLSCCELYTTCEPCPMCWGGCNWARLSKIYIGATRKTAAKYGFDDEFFYQELDLPHDRRSVKCINNLMTEQVKEVFENSSTYKRRMRAGKGMMAKVYEQMFGEEEKSLQLSQANGARLSLVEGACHDEFMRAAIHIAREGQAKGESKEREPFGAVVVKDGKVIAQAYNTVLKDDDPTATAECNAIRMACKMLNTYVLDECDLYTTTEPDPMSLGAIYWSRVRALHVGVSQKLAAFFGFEDGLLHYKELEATPEERFIPTTVGVMAEECEQVFQRWQKLEGKIY